MGAATPDMPTQAMLSEAWEILRRPKFGDPRSIQAKRIVEEYAEAQDWRELLAGSSTKCEHCSGKGYLYCDLGHRHDCPECDGNKRMILTADELRYMGLAKLRQIAEEQGYLPEKDAAA